MSAIPPTRRPLYSAPIGVRGVLDDRQSVPTADRHDLVEVAGMPGEVHGNERPRPRRDRCLDGGGIDVERCRIRRPTNTGRRSPMDDDVGGRGKGDRRGDHLVARADANRLEREVQRRRARVHGHAVAGAGVGGKLLLERLGPRPGGDPPRTQRLEDRLLVVCVDQRLMERQERRPDRRAAFDGKLLPCLDFHQVSFCGQERGTRCNEIIIGRLLLMFNARGGPRPPLPGLQTSSGTRTVPIAW